MQELPPGYFVSIIVGSSTIYVAASFGVFTSPEAGQNWFAYSRGLPHVEIQELLSNPQGLFVATLGRGFWHKGIYDYPQIPEIPFVHAPDVAWLVEVYFRVHGGDPPPQLRQQIGSQI
jgi:hypothetical protein